jgi:predicted RNase H-like nuclease (RuvC/YqgF family)
MRLSGNSAPDNSTKRSGWPANNQSQSLHLKSETKFEQIFQDAQFTRVTAEIVDPNELRSSLNSSPKNDNRFSKKTESKSTPSWVKTAQRVDEKQESSSELKKEVQQLRKELAEVKNLALNNKEALDSLRPMPRAYANTNYSNNQKNQINGVSISQAELHYLRYGSSKSNLDILA